MNESIKTFSLIVITICVFVMTVIDILHLLDERKAREEGALSVPNISAQQPGQHQPPVNSVPNQPKTQIKFEETRFDFGKIKEGETVNHTFSFTNTGSNPLIISNAAGSCGCTVPTWPKEPIPPGGSASIEVQFNSSGKPGEQDKTVNITANTDPPPAVLNIHASVSPKE